MLENAGNADYFGESVTQLAHALQTADRARASGADDEMILAALLHDIGHLLDGETREDIGVVDHDRCAMSWLRERGFGDRLVELVGSHVDAKRYLVATQPAYRKNLSEASQRTLAVQGGPMDNEEAQNFELRRRFKETLRLRVWDEQAKDPDAAVPGLEAYRQMLVSYLEGQQPDAPPEFN